MGIIHNGQKIYGEGFDHIVANRIQELTNNLSSMRQIFLKSLDPRRDIYAECGFPATGDITNSHYRNWYERDPIARRAVQLYAKECWQVQPMVYEDEDSEEPTEFEVAWDNLGKSLRGGSWYQDEQGSPVWEHLARADKLSGIGHYGVLLLGIDDGKPLSEPAEFVVNEDEVPTGVSIQGTEAQYQQPFKSTSPNKKKKGKEKNLTYLRSYDEMLVSVTRWDGDPNSSRYGQPVMYKITMFDPTQPQSGTGIVQSTQDVHWTRTIHLADNLDASECLATPRLLPIVNSILGLQKLYAGDPEAFWKGMMMRLFLESNPALGGDVDADIPSLRTMMENMENGTQKWGYLQGMSAKTVSPSVVDPTSHVNVQIEAICIVLGCPIRVFKGSERGELASSQDDSSWNDRLRERQNGYITPRIIVQFIDRLIKLGILPIPKVGNKTKATKEADKIGGKVTEVANAYLVVNAQGKITQAVAKGGYSIEWPDLDSLSDKDKVQIATQKTSAITQYASGTAPTQIAPMDFWTKIMDYDEEEAQTIVDNAMAHADELAQQQMQMQQQQMMAQGGFPGQDQNGGEPPPEDQQGGDNGGDGSGDGGDSPDSGQLDLDKLLGNTRSKSRWQEFSPVINADPVPTLHKVAEQRQPSRIGLQPFNTGTALASGSTGWEPEPVPVDNVEIEQEEPQDLILEDFSRLLRNREQEPNTHTPEVFTRPFNTFGAIEPRETINQETRPEQPEEPNLSQEIDEDISLEEFSRLLRNECGTGAGGFKKGNTCAIGGAKTKSTAANLLKSIKESGGFTYHPQDDNSPTEGFSVAIHRDAEKTVPLKDVKAGDVLDYILKHKDRFEADPELCVGSWVHKGQVYFDLPRVVPDLETAFELGRKHDQLDVFDLKNFKSLEVPSTPTQESRRDRERRQQATANHSKTSAGSTRPRKLRANGGQSIPAVNRQRTDTPGTSRDAEEGWVEVANDDGCGTGAGGFKKGNTCAKSDKKSDGGYKYEYPRPVNDGKYHIMLDSKAHLAIEKMFKGDLRAEEVAKVAGAIPGAVVNIYGLPRGNGVSVVINHHDYHAERTILKDRIVNDYFLVAEAGKGLGTEIFANQVTNAVEHGFTSINTVAAREPATKDSPALVGYWTWPNLGYDGMGPMGVMVSKHMEHEEGRKWWKMHGETTPMTFDLTEGSYSRRTLDAYRAKRKQAGRQAQIRTTTNSDSGRRGYSEFDLGSNRGGRSGGGARIQGSHQEVPKRFSEGVSMWSGVDNEGWEPILNVNPNHDNKGRFAKGGGSKASKDSKKPKTKVGTRIKSEKTTKVGKVYNPDVEAKDVDGITKAARVGVPAMSVPPPPKIGQLPNLTLQERKVETEFRDAFHKDPKGMARDYLETIRRKKDPGEVLTFATDDAKILSKVWHRGDNDDLSFDQRSQNRATLNVALHQTANAIAKRAFLMHLDTLKPGDDIMVTVGGCGGGKGFSLENNPEVLAMSKKSKAIWDSAGDQNATENPWIQKEAEKRGLRATYVYVHADPKNSWANPKFGVVARAGKPTDGRMVDADVFADSYAIGARNHQQFYENNKKNPYAKFKFLAAGVEIPGIPQEALHLDRHELANFARETVAGSGAPFHVIRGATIGTRIWGGHHD